MTETYRIVLLGQTGSGKSQLCNFIYQDKNNEKFAVSHGLDSQTKLPQTEIFNRKINDNQYNIELIDSAGCSDSEGDDEENFKSLIEKLKEKKTIHLFMFVFNFTNRVDNNTKNYIKFIANTFTPIEFFNHLVIIFTNYKENPTPKEEEKKNIKTNQIIDVIKKTIGIAGEGINSIPKVYELDTELNEDGNFIEKFQATIDVILLNMISNIKLNDAVDTENIKYNNVKDRIQQEKEEYEKKFKEFENQKKKYREEQKYKLESYQRLIKITKEREEQANELERRRREYEERLRKYENIRNKRRVICTIF